MKKIISLGAAAAVLSLTAVAASAAIAPTITPASPVAGDTVTVEIVANGMNQEATTFTVKASENLTLTANEAVAGGLFSTETNKFAWAGTAVPADGTVLLTLTYTVDAAADEEVSVALVADAGFTDISADAVAAVVVDGEDTNVTDVATVDVSTEDVYTEDVSTEVVTSEDVSGVTTDDSGIVDTADTSDVAGTTDSGDNTGDNGNAAGDKGNPGTGVALAVVPAVLAGAAIVVAKKRK